MIEERYISGRELIEKKVFTIKELGDLCANGDLQAYSIKGYKVVNLVHFCPGNDYPKLELLKLKLEEYLKENISVMDKLKTSAKAIFDRCLDDDMVIETAASGILFYLYNQESFSTEEITGIYPFSLRLTDAYKFGITEKEYIATFLEFVFVKQEIARVLNSTAHTSNQLTSKEKNSYLKIIAALCQNPGKIDTSSRESTGQIRIALEKIGLNLSDDTIKKVKDEIQVVMEY